LIPQFKDSVSCRRLRDSTLTPAKPKSLLFTSYATITALAREVSYATAPPLLVGRRILHFAPLGPVLVILAYLVVVLVFCFYKLDTTNQWKWEDVGYRTGFVNICQLPLIFLLSGRQNIIGYLVGMSYDQLNLFHRWIARTLWLTATIHMGFWFRSWGRYGYIAHQLLNDELTKRGFAAWCILTFIVFTSAAPIRSLGYEFFVLQHLVTFVGFTVAVWLHAPDEVKVWVWIAIGLLAFDRVARYAWATYANLSIFHRSRDSKHPIWANQASFTPLPGNVTRITIENPVVRWQPGQHVFLTCHSIAPLQSHPFTIASIPDDNRMEFLVRAESGGTGRFFRYASKQHDVFGSVDAPPKPDRTVFIDGPYGRTRPLRQFDSVILLAGGMGATFTIPCLRDIVAAWKTECQQPPKSRTRLTAAKRIRFVWVIRSRAHLSWFESALQAVLADVEECRRMQPDTDREVEMSIYLTCDDKLEPSSLQSALCAPNQAEDPIEKPKEDAASVKPTSPASASTQSPTPKQPAQGCCLPGGGCCCTAPVENEDEITAQECTCSGPVPPQPQSQPQPTETTAASEKRSSISKPPIAPNPTILSGRPKPRSIIRKALERAEGESAVAVCGPSGLSDDVRRSAVYLSDERAVHKGTGAQGIYLHVEKFGW
jgi:predicted ferric reductase